jgi:hypothetical protein
MFVPSIHNDGLDALNVATFISVVSTFYFAYFFCKPIKKGQFKTFSKK